MRTKTILTAFIVTLLSSWTLTYSQPNDVKIQFRVKWDGKVIPDVSKVSGLRRVTEAIENRPGGDPNVMRYSPGISRYVPIVLKRPRSFDTSFEQWANKVWNFGSGLGAEVSLRDYRKDIIIELCDDTGKVLMAFKVYRCWISEYIALTDLDADEDASAMEVLVLHHEGWERDYSIR
jgi:phage tail-like protein